MNSGTTIVLLHWLPRLICMGGIAFISVLSVHGGHGAEPLMEQLMRHVQHLIPALILTVVLWVAWRWERIGGIVLLSIGLGLAPVVYLLNHVRNHFSVGSSVLVVLVVNGPFVLAGILFLLSERQKRKL